MKSELDKMLDGELYDASDPALMQRRVKARSFLATYNQTPYDKPVREKLLKGFLGKIGQNADIQAPFYCDYGSFIHIGDNFYANFNCVILDCNMVTIGNNVFFGPGVQIYAAHHPVIASERIKGPEYGSPVTIRDNVWIGGGAIICPGVTIGENSTIGAGSIVTRSIPPFSLAVGNPCRVLRVLEP